MSEHPEELLPWYANDTLAGEERARVERHLAGCAYCRAELALLQAMRREVKALDAAAPPGELARARLLKEARRSRPPRARWMPVALAASLALVVIQAAVLVSLLPRDDRYAPLGGETAPGVIVQVRFAPEATEREMRAVLGAVNGTIVEGPGALGVYRVRLAAIPPEDGERIAAAIETLRAAAPVVTHVEREP
ncbi:MAG TPA: zf-HC2 domain-containing protein [Burkholderiales bacterium]